MAVLSRPGLGLEILKTFPHQSLGFMLLNMFSLEEDMPAFSKVLEKILMVFGRILASVGNRGAKLETRISESNLSPGGMLRGTVNLLGGSADETIDRIDVALEGSLKLEQGERAMVFDSRIVGQTLQIRAGQMLELPFEKVVPWDTPLNRIDGHDLPLAIHLSTYIHLEDGADSEDSEALRLRPLPAQQLVLDAMQRLGFRLHESHINCGRIPGARLPFFQELVYRPGTLRRDAVREVGVIFVSRPAEMDVTIEVERSAYGFRTRIEGLEEEFRTFRISYGEAHRSDLERLIERALRI